MQELFLDSDGMLVGRQQWEASVDSMRNESSSLEPLGGRTAEIAVSKAFSEAVRSRIPAGRFGVMFSGGVDSSLIALMCKLEGADFVCYTTGFGHSKDASAARQASEELGIRLVSRAFSLDEISDLAGKVCLLGMDDVVNVGVGCVAYAAASMAKEDGIRFLFSGLGSEEIFAGYRRHAMARDVNAECWSGLVNMWSRDLIRDCSIAGSLGVQVATPFLDRQLIIEAMRVPGNEKIGSDGSKLVLRRAALRLGLPESIAKRKKVAAQYGSGFDAAMTRLARLRGLSGKQELVRRIIAESRIAQKEKQDIILK
ncbi:asparagine synthase C-terminal domain-containing protein [Candidatus Woesearchaeota archaeon]|nr:asparagine synthase C-terminal domain-containing protein [Candidatus Woesearchaeota archaeon]